MVGRAIVLVGVSSVGKTSVSEELQLQLSEPFLHVGLDHFLSMFPQRWKGQVFGPGPGMWYHDTVDPDGAPRGRIRYGSVGRRMLAGMRGAVNALLDAGNDVIVDEMPLDETIVPAWRRDLRASASFWVHLTAPLEVLEQRERSRVGGKHLGNARGHFGIAPDDGWDLTLPVEKLTPAEAAAQIIDAVPFLRND
jgi:chloramphenicol 3-O phosphotransferase